VDGVDLTANETRHDGRVMSRRGTSIVTCEVSRDRIVVRCNGAEVIDWKGNATRLSASPDWKSTTGKSLFLGSLGTAYRVRRLVVIPN